MAARHASQRPEQGGDSNGHAREGHIIRAWRLKGTLLQAVLEDFLTLAKRTLGVVQAATRPSTSRTLANCMASVMILLQKVIPLCCEQESQEVQQRTDGNHEAHIPRSSKPIA